MNGLLTKSYCWYLFASGANYGSTPHFLHESELPNQGFSSLYAVDEGTARAVEQEGSARQFKGIVWHPLLWLDIDSYEQAQTVQEGLNRMELGYVAFDSGGRGAHFGITRETTPSHLLPAKDKAWVKANFPMADSSIYTHLHPFRLGGSVHEKTGRRKELVHAQKGKALVIPSNILEESNVDPTRNNSLDSTSSVSVFSCRRVMAYTKAYTEGGRHAGLVRLAYALRDDAGVDKATAYWWLTQANKLSEAPKGDEEVLAAMRSIYE